MKTEIKPYRVWRGFLAFAGFWAFPTHLHSYLSKLADTHNKPSAEGRAVGAEIVVGSGKVS